MVRALMSTWVHVTLGAVVLGGVGLWLWMTPAERLGVLDGVKAADAQPVKDAAGHATSRLAAEGKRRAAEELVGIADDALDAVKAEMHAAVEEAAEAAGDRVRDELGVQPPSTEGRLGQKGVDHLLDAQPVVGQSGG